jgi:hypothetical protein
MPGLSKEDLFLIEDRMLVVLYQVVIDHILPGCEAIRTQSQLLLSQMSLRAMKTPFRRACVSHCICGRETRWTARRFNPWLLETIALAALLLGLLVICERCVHTRGICATARRICVDPKFKLRAELGAR